MDTAQRLRRQRDRAGLTLSQAGERIGVGKQYVSKLELGVNHPPAWDHLRNLARLYQTSSDYLLGLTDDPQPSNGRVYVEHSEDLLYHLGRMSPYGRAALITVAAALANLDQEWQERQRWAAKAARVSQPGEAAAMRLALIRLVEQTGNLEQALRALTELELTDMPIVPSGGAPHDKDAQEV